LFAILPTSVSPLCPILAKWEVLRNFVMDVPRENLSCHR
jgi:hypothetical protein